MTVLAGSEAETRVRRTSAWTALRRDAAHAPELAVLYALPHLSPQVGRWAATRASNGPADRREKQARRVLRESARVARRGGAITGSSFYVGMVPAMVMIYLEQLVALLRIAATFGRDPADPARAAEILVIQGRYETVAAAAAALRQVGTRRERTPGFRAESGVGSALRQVPFMIGLQMRRLKNPMDLIIVVVEVVSFLFPVLSIPVWAHANARATRRLASTAIAFYTQDRPAASTGISVLSVAAPPGPSRRGRLKFLATVIPLAVSLGVLAAFLPLGRYAHNLRWAGLVLAEAALFLTFARLITITRPAWGRTRLRIRDGQ